jgi:hypothetical protein
MTAASEFVLGDASAAQTSDNGKRTAPIVKETNTVRTRSKDISAATTITFLGVAGRVTDRLPPSRFQIQDSKPKTFGILDLGFKL